VIFNDGERTEKCGALAANRSEDDNIIHTVASSRWNLSAKGIELKIPPQNKTEMALMYCDRNFMRLVKWLINVRALFYYIRPTFYFIIPGKL